jgi:hypothetical protein
MKMAVIRAVASDSSISVSAKTKSPAGVSLQGFLALVHLDRAMGSATLCHFLSMM